MHIIDENSFSNGNGHFIYIHDQNIIHGTGGIGCKTQNQSHIKFAFVGML